MYKQASVACFPKLYHRAPVKVYKAFEGTLFMGYLCLLPSPVILYEVMF